MAAMIVGRTGQSAGSGKPNGTGRRNRRANHDLDASARAVRDIVLIMLPGWWKCLIEAFVPEMGIEALEEPVLPQLARRFAMPSDLARFRPAHGRITGSLCAPFDRVCVSVKRRSRFALRWR